MRNSYVSSKYDVVELSTALRDILAIRGRSSGRIKKDEISLNRVARDIIDVYKEII